MSLRGSLTVGHESRIFQTGGLDVTQRFGVHKVDLGRLRAGALPLGFFKGLKQELLEQFIEVVVVTTPKFL